MKKNNNIQQLVIAIVTVVAIIAIVGGSTFAYFQWTTNEAQKTNVNVTIAAGGITMVINQANGEFEASGLRPVADCNNSMSYMDAAIVITNTTGTLAVPSFKLKGKVTVSQGALTSADLAHIHYSVVKINSIGDASAPKCNQPATVADGGSFTNNYSTSATGTFANVSTAGVWTDMPEAANDDYLARSYNAGVADGITFVGAKAGTSGSTITTAYFRVYVWVDETYTYTNVGNAVTDPLQNATISVQWSENSIVEQVAD